MHAYVRELRSLLTRNAHPAQAGPMKRYMRDQFEYLGIKSPQLSELLRRHHAAQGLPDASDLDDIVRELWSLPQREFQYVALNLIEKLQKSLPEKFIETLEYLLVTKSWWDTVDAIAADLVGGHFVRYPKARKKYLARWRASRNFWLRRTTLLFQLRYKDDTDFDLLRDLIRENLGSSEFFINKAIGWALRQYTRVDPRAVRTFVAETPLNPLSAREALKWLERRQA